MKILGIIGGIGSESTIDYYRSLIRGRREQRADESYPPIIINSIDVKRMLDLIAASKLSAVTVYCRRKGGPVRLLKDDLLQLPIWLGLS